MKKIIILGAVIISALLCGSSMIIPASDALSIQQKYVENLIYEKNGLSTEKNQYENPIQRSENDPFIVTDEEASNSVSLDTIENDMGYNVDVSGRMRSAASIFIGEPVDNAPGRTRQGTLDPDGRDEEDWYRFMVCEGQQMQVVFSSSEDFNVYLSDQDENNLGQSYTADYTGMYFACVHANEGANAGSYTFDVALTNQNDANTGSDAGDTMNGATLISSGSYVGYMDFEDVEDWYRFSVSAGQGIQVYIEPIDDSDYDLHLYNPNGQLVLSEKYYGEDTIEYPADISGQWVIKIDMFPGWDESKWPDNYFLYGSGPYELTLQLGGTYDLPVTPLAQPDIIPIPQTFTINDDPTGVDDEYAYLAAVPAANYLMNGNRYVSPIVYQGNNEITNWYGTTDDTTQYLLDDWQTYLDRHAVTAEEYILSNDPVQAASEIAVNSWAASSSAVIVCDGSVFTDEIETLVDDDISMSSTPDISRYQPSDFTSFNNIYAAPMYIGNEWGAIHMIALGDTFEGDTGLLTPRYEEVKFDDWPSPYDVDGPDYDTWYPITKTGLWVPEITSVDGLEELQIIKYPGDRYTIPIDTTDCSIEVTIKTEEPSTLLTYLIDPLGNIRRPTIPEWNGGEIKPIHWWNGGHWEHNFDDYRYWIVEPHTEFSVDLHYPMEGDWTLIVVPYFDHPEHYGEYVGTYHLTTNIRKHNPDRIDAAISAANAAVIASMNHLPLLYVTQDSVPSATQQAINALGVNSVMFVNLNQISTASLSGSVTELTTMQDIIDTIKAHASTENYITITSLGSGKGFFASAAMLAAYHTSPVLSIHEAADAYDVLDKMVKWEEFTGDHYHGCRTMGHLPALTEPISLTNPPSLLNIALYYLTHQQELPPIGLDLKLQWYSQIHDGIRQLVDGYNLDQSGQECFMFVSPRETDMPSHISRVMMGNESYAGQIPFDSPAMNTALICRDILYPALIYANPGRDYTSACIMNHWEDNSWKTNDGISHNNEVTRVIKEYYSSYGRIFEGHTLWNNLLERYNSGASVLYHTSHGTGGSGICCMYENVEEQFPLAELTHEHLKDFNWWDAWRGYYFDDRVTKTPRENGRVWFNPTDDPYNNLYDIVHFKWCDQLFDNLHSQFNLWQSCTTAHNFGPEIYLEHGAAIYYGNSNTGRSPQTDMQDSWWFEDFMVNGISIGESQSKILWLFDRDYTTGDPTSIYGISSTDKADQYGDGEGLVNTWLIFGDPCMQVYNPTWIEPAPLEI
jgi:hypothetical protein